MQIFIGKSAPFLGGRSYVRFVSGAPKSRTYGLSNVRSIAKKSPKKPKNPTFRHTFGHTALALLCVLLSVPIHSIAADFYLTGGAGWAKFEHDNGVWYQDGFPYKMKNRTPTYHAGIGLQVNQWLAIEGLYHDLGKGRIDATFTPQDSNYSAETKGCVGECLPLAKGFGNGRWRGISISILPQIPVTKNLTLYARIGAINVMSSWTERVDFGEWEWVYEFRERQKRPLLGVGLRYNGAYAEFSSWSRRHGSDSGYKGQMSLNVGYRVMF